MPKSSSAMETPSSRRRRSDSMVVGPVWNTVSVISSSSALGGNPVASSVRPTCSTKSLSKNCGARDIDGDAARCQPCARQAAAAAVAERRTQSVSSWMRPVFSATWMNSVSGGDAPVGLAPAQQRLERRDLEMCERHLRLEHQQQLAGLDRRRSDCSRRKRCAAASYSAGLYRA